MNEAVRSGHRATKAVAQSSVPVVEVNYTLTYSFPVSSGDVNVVGSEAYMTQHFYFRQLQGLIVNNTVNGRFDAALNANSKDGFPSVRSYPAPVVSGPFYIPPAALPMNSTDTPPVASLAAGSVGDKLLVFIGVACALVVVLLVVLGYVRYIQVKQRREAEMAAWTLSESDDDPDTFTGINYSIHSLRFRRGRMAPISEEGSNLGDTSDTTRQQCTASLAHDKECHKTESGTTSLRSGPTSSDNMESGLGHSSMGSSEERKVDP